MKCTFSDRAQRFEREALPLRDELWRAARRLTGDSHEAEDLLQETFTKAFAAFDRFEEGTNARAWLHTILRNTFISGLRGQGREFNVADPGDVAGAVPDPSLRSPDSRTPEEQVLQRDSGEPVRSALRAVPARYRWVLLLVDVKGYSYAEAATAGGVPIGTIMSRLHRGRRRLRARLAAGPRGAPADRKGEAYGRPVPRARGPVGRVPHRGEHERT